MSAVEIGDGSADVSALARQWSSMMRAVPDLVTVVDSDGYVEYVSPSARRLLGLAPEQVIGHLACEFIAAEDRRNCALWAAHARVANDLPGLVHRVMHRDGTSISVESSLRPMPDVGDHAQRTIIVSRDISERTMADEQMGAMLQMWTEIYDVVREGVLVLDRGAQVLTANRGAGALLGLESASLPGTCLGEHLRVVSVDGDSTLIDRFLRGGAFHQPAADVFVARRREPRGETLRMSAMPLVKASGTAHGERIVVLLDGAAERPLAPAAAAGRLDLRALLSPREIEVLQLLAEGLDVRAVSAKLGISIHTTRNYVKSVLHKLDVRTQLQAVVIALRAGLSELS